MNTQTLSPLADSITKLNVLAQTNPLHFFKTDWEMLDMHLEAYESRHPKLGHAVRELRHDSLLQNRDETNRHLKLILLNVLKCCQSQKPFAIAYPSSWKTIKALTPEENPIGITPTISTVVNALAEAGFLFVLSGKIPVQLTGRDLSYNRVLPTPKMVDLMEALKLTTLPLEISKSAGFVSVTIKQDTDDAEARSTVSLATFKRPDELLTIKKSNEVLRAYNKLLSKTSIELAHGQIAPNGHSKKVFRRFCRGNLQCGGRLYGGFWQGLATGKKGTRKPPPYRKDLLINGEPTIELDYSGLHINLLYALAGKEPRQDDVYALAGWPRGIVKLYSLIALNAKGDGFRVLQQKVKEDPDLALHYDLLLKGGCKKLKADFAKKHPLIAARFHADEGVKLQKLDSDIALLVIEKMMKLPDFVANYPVPVLSVHDSFICPKPLEVTLKSCMIGVFEKMMKTTSAPPIKSAV